MLIQAHSPNPHFFFLPPNPSISRHVSHACRFQVPMGRRSERMTKIYASAEHNPPLNLEKRRKVFEHISLLQAKGNISEEEENGMLDYLYTTQYQMRGIVAISLGRACDQNNERYTHGVYMRFQRKEDLENFYVNPFYSRVLEEHVMPYCHELIHVDYESEVEDDMLFIFRKGEEFNYGVEYVLLIKFLQDSFGEPLEDALNSLERLTIDNPSLIVQFTQVVRSLHMELLYDFGQSKPSRYLQSAQITKMFLQQISLYVLRLLTSIRAGTINLTRRRNQEVQVLACYF